MTLTSPAGAWQPLSRIVVTALAAIGVSIWSAPSGSTVGTSAPSECQRWDMRRSPVPAAEALLQSVSAASSDDVWAVGSQGELPIVEHWDGGRWRLVADDAS